MRKFTPLLSLLLIAALFVSCLPEEQITAPDFNEHEPYELLPAKPADLVNASLGMADIHLKRADGSKAYYAMPSCLLTVIQVGCGEGSYCLAKIDEEDSSLKFRNTTKETTTGTERISFHADPNAGGSGIHLTFLEEEVFPLVANAEWTINKRGPNYVLSCVDCALEYHGEAYVGREVVLR